MQKSEKSLLLIHRENYVVPKGQEQRVHCKIAKLDEKGNFIELPRIRTYGLRGFETLFKENMEKLGYTLEILYHPQKRYSGAVIRNDATAIAEKDAEIEALKAQLEAKAEAEAKAKAEAEANEQMSEKPEKKQPRKRE